MLQLPIILITLAGIIGLFSIIYRGKQFINPFWVNRIDEKNARVVGIVFCLALLIFGILTGILSLRI